MQHTVIVSIDDNSQNITHHNNRTHSYLIANQPQQNQPI